MFSRFIRLATVSVSATLIGVVVHQSVAGSTPTTSTTSSVPKGTSVFDQNIPAVTNLNVSLLTALRRAAEVAKYDDIEFVLNSGWRSRAYQEKLLQDAIKKYGSRAAAARWVATPDTSPHVSGDAVDVGPTKAAAWLARHGSAFGLCQIYRNEPWHFEYRPQAIHGSCPRMYADPTFDPRMQG